MTINIGLMIDNINVDFCQLNLKNKEVICDFEFYYLHVMGIVKGDFTSYIEKFISLGLDIM